LGPRQGVQATDRWGPGAGRMPEMVSRDPDRWIGSGRFRSSAYGANGSVACAAPVRGSGVARDSRRPPWGLGSPGLAGTGEEGLANSLVRLRPRERDRR
jgi:hypothetical protein